MQNLYDQHKPAWDKIASDGFKNLAEAAKHFASGREMDYAIGFNNAVHHWLKGGRASRSSDERARRWLENRRAALDETPKNESALPQGSLLLVACPKGTEEKARKLLAFIGCEVTDV